ncbi:hypothetical protein WG922_07040 [Ramlibacter sp. AN1015]|uniref:hypothetical protein n=1 Tax=Ramlibacter sp. AN1015 TaxID=3133428 RepID=UPI0030C52126
MSVVLKSVQSSPARRERPQLHTYQGQELVDRLLRWLLCVFVATFVLEAPLRWALVVWGFPNALYLRDVIPIGSLTLLLFRPLLTRRWIDPLITVPLCLLGIHGAVGLALGVAPIQVALGFKLFMYPLYGIAMWPLLADHWTTVLRASAVAFAVTLFGVILNFFLGPMLWDGMEYDTIFGTVSASRQWWISGGIPRLAGLARASFNAAMIIGITGLLCMVWLRPPWLRLLIAVLAVAGIAATTSKGMLLAFPIAAVWLLFDGRFAHILLGRMLVYVLCSVSLALPIGVVLLELGSGLAPVGFPNFLFSVWERFSWMWPSAFDLLPKGVGWVLGGGLGSIGTPQLFGPEPHRFNAADSLAVLLLVNFGVAGTLYFLLPACTLRRVTQVAHPDQAKAFIALLIVTYGYGFSISMVEEPFFALCIGLALGMAANPGLTAQRRNTRVPERRGSSSPDPSARATIS